MRSVRAPSCPTGTAFPQERIPVVFHNFVYFVYMSLTTNSPLQVAQSASLSARILATLPSQARNDALTAIHTALSGAKNEILAANARDMEAAAKSAENGELSLSVLKRLDLGRKGKWEDMLRGILDVRGLEDPGGCTFINSAISISSQVSVARNVAFTKFYSWQNQSTDTARHWSRPRAGIVSHWNPPHHFRGPSRSNCEHRFPCH
jgi:hypothetical protein